MKTFNPLTYTNAPRKHRVSRVIDAPLHEVWDIVADHQGMTRWMPLISHVDLKTPDAEGGWGEGCERNCQFGPDLLEETVVYWDPPHGYAYAIADMHLLKDHVGHIALAKTDGGTRVTWTQYFHPNGFPPKAWFANKVMIPRVMRRALRNLERDATAAARRRSRGGAAVASLLLALALVLGACTADLRTRAVKDDTQGTAQRDDAEQLLRAAVAKQGLDRAAERYDTYEVTASDHWRGLLGGMGRVWNWGTEEMALRYTIGDFDGQVEVLEGKRAGFVAGVQSHDYYEVVDGRYDTDVRDDRRLIFALNAFHYFFELGPRLLRAPVIRAYEGDTFGGEAMRGVYVSWGDERSRDYDQYVVWIGEASGLIEAVTHTVRDNYLPGAQPLYTSTEFDDFRDFDGVLIPCRQTVTLFGPSGKTDRGYVHQLTVRDFAWDAFPPEDIRPDPALAPVGDAKPES